MPHTEVPVGVGVSITVRVLLDGSSEPAQRAFGKEVQAYAEKLASESARQEASARATGAMTCEITESAVIRAAESLQQQTAKERPPRFREAAAVAGKSMCTAAMGTMGNFLHSAAQVSVFAGLSIVAAICILQPLKRRL
jgi:hypothetical protein